MTRSKNKKHDERERMTAAMRRLEELLADPGPNITVTPVAERDYNRLKRTSDIPEYEQPKASAAAAAAEQKAPPQPPADGPVQQPARSAPLPPNVPRIPHPNTLRSLPLPQAVPFAVPCAYRPSSPL